MPLEAELDLSGKFPICDMPKSGLEGEKASRTISVGDSEHREDLKTHGQLPDYDEFQGYYMGAYSELRHADGGIMPIFTSYRGKLRISIYFWGGGIRRNYCDISKFYRGVIGNTSWGKIECLRAYRKFRLQTR